MYVLIILLIRAACLVHLNSNLYACYDFITSVSWKTIVRKDSGFLECDSVSLGEWFLYRKDHGDLRMKVPWSWIPSSTAVGTSNLKLWGTFYSVESKCCTSEQRLYVTLLQYHLYSIECSYDDTLNSERWNRLDHLQDEWIKNTKENMGRKNIW